ncbi:efflux transporter outer membrane subunit [Propionivibrio limicola]|uniref:efflux transporter outer membrane subunit n=1 Tax=Propionivibrio limicola TaxID=167645 RepID=UPI001292386A|nr:efflux transporter outer membrane subunit [Propionivibrio limicola]
MRKIASTSITLLALLTGGCMIGPDYYRPAVDTPQAWRLTDEGAKDLANTPWWEQFDDPVLNELVATALRENKDLLIAIARIDEYAGRYGITRSALFPQIGAGYDAAKQKNTLPGTSVQDVYNTYDAFLGASWEIDLWGKIRRQSEAARAQLVASEQGRQGVILSLVANVASAYINLRDLDRQLEIAVSTAKAREGSYKLFQDRYAGGVISLLELSQNKSQYEEALATIPSLEKSIVQQENALSVLLGRNPGPIARGKTIDELMPPATPEGLPSSLLERRPDILEAEQLLISANAQIGAAKAAYYPTISLTGLLGSASSNLSDLFSGPAKVWQYGAAINLPIFTGGLLAGQVQVAEAQQQQALLSYQKAIQNAFREVNDALIDQDRTRAQLATQRLQVEALQQYSDTARLRYDNGYTSYIEVLDAERSLFNAQLQYTQTQQTRLQAAINLYKAMGGGWVAEAEKLSLPAEKKAAGSGPS